MNLKKIIILISLFTINIESNYDPAQVFMHLKLDPQSPSIKQKLSTLSTDPNFSINARDQRGNTALIIAARKGDFSIAKHLLEAGAQPKLKNNQGLTALSYAQKHNHRKIYELLSPPSPIEDIPRPETPPAEREIVESLLQMSPIEDIAKRESPTANKNEQLNSAIRHRNENLVRKLLYGADRITNLNEQNRAGITPIMIATSIRESNSIMQHLLSRGASIYLKDNDGNSVLEWAKQFDNELALQLLRHTIEKHNELREQTKQNQNAEGWSKYFKQVVQPSSPDIIKAAAFYDSTNNLVDIEQIIRQNPDSVVQKGPFNTTALMIAAARGESEIVDTLLYFGANFNQKDVYGRTAFDYLMMIPPSTTSTRTVKLKPIGKHTPMPPAKPKSSARSSNAMRRLPPLKSR